MKNTAQIDDYVLASDSDSNPPDSLHQTAGVGGHELADPAENGCGPIAKAENTAPSQPRQAPATGPGACETSASRIPTKAELEKLYAHDHLSMRDIASRFNISTRTVLRWLKRHGVKSRLPFNLKMIDRENLDRLIAEGNTQNEIAKKLKVHKKTVYNWLKKYKIKTDPTIKRRKKLLAKSLTERNLRNLYVKGGLSIKGIARHYKVHFRTIRRLLYDFNIPIRKEERKLPDREELQTLYQIDGLTTKEIGTRFKVSDTTVVRWLRQQGIELRRGGPNPKRPRFTREQLNQYRKLSIKEIARICGVPRETIRYWLARYEITLQNSKTPRQPRFSRRLLYDLHIVEKLDASHIAERYGLSESTVHHWLQHYGLTSLERSHRNGKELAEVKD